MERVESMNQKKREEKNGIWLKRFGSIGLCHVQEVEELQKEMNQAECKIKLLQEERTELQRKNRRAHEISVAQIKKLLLQTKETDFEKLEGEELFKACCFPVNENPETGKWYVSMNICSLGGCEFNDYEFTAKWDAFEFGSILTQLGDKPELGSACPDCYAEYIKECI